MNKTAIRLIFTGLLLAGSGSALACEFKVGETKYLDYANCRYGEESVVVIDLPQDSDWEKCLYFVEAFRPEKLLAVTKLKDGKEILSINDRAKIGNPCYLTKQRCDAALKNFNQSVN